MHTNTVVSTENTDDGNQDRPCCNSCRTNATEFTKVVDLTRAGLVIYRHTIKTANVNKLTGNVDNTTKTTEDVFILHNTKNVDIPSREYLSEMETRDIPCKRCRQIMSHAYKLLQNVPNINKNDIVGICDHCKLKYRPCYECEKTIKKFRNKPQDIRKERVKEWLIKVKEMLDNSFLDSKVTDHKLKETQSEIRIDQLRRSDSPPCERVIDIKELFEDSEKPEEEKAKRPKFSEESRKHFFSKLDKLELEAVDGPLLLLKSPERKSKSAVYYKGGRLTAPFDEHSLHSSEFDDDIVVSDTRKDKKKHTSLKDIPSASSEKKPQTSEFDPNVSSLGYLPRKTPQRSEFDHDVSSPGYLPQKKPHTSEFDHNVSSPGYSYQDGREKEKARSKVPTDSSYLPTHTEAQKVKVAQEQVTPSMQQSNFLENNLKKSIERSANLSEVVRKYHSDEALLATTGIETNALKKQFHYYFPKKKHLEKPKEPKSSSELIKDTQDNNLRIKAEKEKIRQEKESKIRKEKQGEEGDQSKKGKQMLTSSASTSKIEGKLGKDAVSGKSIKDDNVNAKQDKPRSESKYESKEPKLEKNISKAEPKSLEGKLKEPKLGTKESFESKRPKLDQKSKSQTKLAKPAAKESKSILKEPRTVSKDFKPETKEPKAATKESKIGPKDAKTVKKETKSEIKSSSPDAKETKEGQAAIKSKKETEQEKYNQEKLDKENALKTGNEREQLLKKEKEDRETEEQLRRQMESSKKEKELEKKQRELEKTQKELSAKSDKAKSKKKQKPLKDDVDDLKNKVVTEIDERTKKNKTGTEIDDQDKIKAQLDSKNVPKPKELELPPPKPVQPEWKTDMLKKAKEEMEQRKNAQALEKEIEQKTKKPEKEEATKIAMLKPSQNAMILDLIKLKQEEDKLKMQKDIDSELELDLESAQRKRIQDISAMIKGPKIINFRKPIHYLPQLEEVEEPGVLPLLFQTKFDASSPDRAIISQPEPKKISNIEVETERGVIRYALSDRTFIEKGWTVLPTEKVVRKMNVYRMRPAHPEFDWFAHNKGKGLMLYDSGERLAEFDDNGRGRWYYKNGRLALDYYDAEELNAQQRFVIFSNGEPDERGRPRPYTILATFDYLGNGIVFDHSGKIRLKYNQTEGVVLDRNIGPVSHWKWHTLNDPPVLQQVMIDTQMSHKDPKILKFAGKDDNKPRNDDEEMLAIEFDNFIKEKSKKLTQSFKPFQIKMKALKINENFSLKVLDQATVYLIFRDGTTNQKLNIGMILDHKEIVDTDTAEVGEVSNNVERLPARTDSLAGLQKSVAYAQRFERNRTERDRRLRPPEPSASVDQLAAAASRPMQFPLRTTQSSTSATTRNSDYCRCRRKPSSNIYYNARLS